MGEQTCVFATVSPLFEALPTLIHTRIFLAQTIETVCDSFGKLPKTFQRKLLECKRLKSRKELIHFQFDEEDVSDAKISATISEWFRNFETDPVDARTVAFLPGLIKHLEKETTK